MRKGLFQLTLIVSAMLLLAATPMSSPQSAVMDNVMWRDLDGLNVVELTPEMVDKCIEIADMVNPALATRLVEFRKKNPDLLKDRLRANGRQLIALALLEKEDETLYALKVAHLRLDVLVSDLGVQFPTALRSGDTASVDQLEPVLMDHVNAQVVLSISEREAYLTQLRQRIERLECELEEDRANVDRLIEQRFRAVLGEDVMLWNKFVADNRTP